ncbi:MAG: hypothetical protein MI754_17175, partial [Chromatiales bacterium]|nr:hypothetical protein [Chromatiales bacterium]
GIGACFTNGLPDNPQSPNYVLESQWDSTDRMIFTLWRESCDDEYYLLVRVTPENNPNLCSSSFTVTQNNKQFDHIRLVESPSDPAFCGALSAPTTLIVEQSQYVEHFERSGAFTFTHTGTQQPDSIDIPAINGPEVNNNIVLNLEEPEHGVVYTGISNLRGWAVAPNGIKRIELYVDGKFADNIPYGGSRGDVGNAYPGYPGAGNSGFSMAYNYKNLVSGPHIIKIRAYDNSENYRETSVVFNVKRFYSSFIGNPKDMDLSNATFEAVDGNSVRFNGVTAEGLRWDVMLRWNTSTQGFEIEEIAPAP